MLSSQLFLHSLSNKLGQKQRVQISMYQTCTSETGEVFKSVNTAKRVVDWFQFELIYGFKKNGNA